MSLTADGLIRCTIGEASAKGAAACLSCGWICTPEPDGIRLLPEPDGGPYLCDKCGHEDLYGIVGLITEGLVELRAP